MAQSAFVARDGANSDDDDTDESEDTQAFEGDAVDHEDPRGDNDDGIKQVKAIHEEGTRGGERLQSYLDKEDRQEDEIDLVQQARVDRKELRHRQVEQNEDRVEADGEE